MLITSCRICQLSFVSDTPSNATCVQTALLHVIIAVMRVMLGAFAGNAKCVVAYIDVHTVDIKNRTGLSHYVWNPLRVCECNLSICSNVRHLDSQCDRHQEKKSASGRTGCVRTHQALGMLWTHPGRAHTAPNGKRTGNVNSDAARCGSVHSDTVCQGAMCPDAARHGIVRPDAVGTASAYWTARVRAFFFWTQPCQGISFWTEHVRVFSFWTQPCQGISSWTQPCQGIFLLEAAVSGHFLLDAAVSGQMASGRRVSWHHGHAGCQGTEHRSKYSRHIRKHAVGSRHSDSVQFYSLYLMYIYICYYHTSRGNKGKLANTIRPVEHDTMSTT